MQRTILTYGPIVGFVVIVTIIIGIEFGLAQEWLGYLIMFIALSAIFFAIRQYRDETQGGVISFRTAFLLGLGISTAAGIAYVALWEVYLAVTDFGFVEMYATSVVEARRAAGAVEAEIAETITEMDRFRAQYMNPLIRLPMTFLEIAPPGILVSLGCAAFLSNHRSGNA
jgi:hypothetical protein